MAEEGGSADILGQTTGTVEAGRDSRRRGYPAHSQTVIFNVYHNVCHVQGVKFHSGASSSGNGKTCGLVRDLGKPLRSQQGPGAHERNGIELKAGRTAEVRRRWSRCCFLFSFVPTSYYLSPITVRILACQLSYPSRWIWTDLLSRLQMELHQTWTIQPTRMDWLCLC